MWIALSLFALWVFLPVKRKEKVLSNGAWPICSRLAIRDFFKVPNGTTPFIFINQSKLHRFVRSRGAFI